MKYVANLTGAYFSDGGRAVMIPVAAR